MKCGKCHRETDHSYDGKHLCEYHYWKIRPENSLDWKTYKHLHPVRVSQWRKQDPEFDVMLRKKGL